MEKGLSYDNPFFAYVFRANMYLIVFFISLIHIIAIAEYAKDRSLI